MATEVLVIPTDMANKIIDEIDQNSFERWKRNGCIIEIKQRNYVHLVLNGTSTENKNLLANEIFPVLKQAQECLTNCYLFMLGLLIPNPKCGYVVGKGGKTIQKIQSDFGVEIFIDNGKREPVPEGFARLFIRTSDSDAACLARAEIRRLEARSLDFNPYAMPRDNKIRLEDGKRILIERIKLPLFAHFTSEQQMHFCEIQKSSAINWTFDDKRHNSKEASNGRFVTLEGDADLVLSAKKRLAKLITEIEQQDFRLHTSSVRLSNSPTTDRPLYQTTFKVPFPAWQLVLGSGGKTINGLKERFGVSMRLLGDNSMPYPEFRRLKIWGYDQLKVHSAREHVEHEFVAKNSKYLGQNPLKAKPKCRRKFLSAADDTNNSIDLIDSNACGRETPIHSWESDEDSWAVDDEPHLCSGFTMDEQKEGEDEETKSSNSEDEILPKWDDDDGFEEQQHGDMTNDHNFGTEQNTVTLGLGEDKMAYGTKATDAQNEDSGVAEDGGAEEDELFLLIEQKGANEAKRQNATQGEFANAPIRNGERQQSGDVGMGGGAINRRTTTRCGLGWRSVTSSERRPVRIMPGTLPDHSLSDGIGNSCVSPDSSAELDIDEPLEQLIFQPLDRNALACQLERAKATLLGDEHLSRELARTQALLRSRDRECEQLRSELRRLKLQLTS